MLEDAYTILKRDEAFRYMAASSTEVTRKESLRSKAVSRSRPKAALSVAG